jgi:hypothetical protein
MVSMPKIARRFLKKPLTAQRAFPTIRALRWAGCEYSLFIQSFKI